MAINLAALDVSNEQAISSGSPLEVPIKQVIEDAGQPRTEFDEEAMQSLTESIKDRGIMQPIIVRPINAKGKYVIIQGARRFRGATRAGLATVPVFVREDDRIFDDYSQVIENIQRQDLRPMELARFVAKRIEAGDKPAEISRKLGIQKAQVTWLLSLTAAPEYIIALYESGECTTPRYLYELATFAKKYPEEAERFCKNSDDFRGKTISNFIEKTVKNFNTGGYTPTELALGSTKQSNDSVPPPTESQAAESENMVVSPTPPTTRPLDILDTEKEPTVADPNKIKRPLLLASYKKHNVSLLLHRKPAEARLIYVRFEDSGVEEEVETAMLKNLTLTEAPAK